ncbi:MAG: alpha/beta fold hydrolase [Planctomycetota bacterium]
MAVLSHCFTCSKDLKAITRISRGLAEAGVAVLRFDMRGLGGSAGEFSNSNFSTNMVDLASAIRFATDELGAVTALVGHSFGGAASLATAAGLEVAIPGGLEPNERDSIQGVVAIAAPSDTVHLAHLLSTMNPAIELDGRGDVSIGGRTWTITQSMLDDFRRHELADALPRIRCPVLLFHSPVDTTVSMDHAVRMMGLVRDGDGQTSATLVPLAGADHLLVDDPRDLILVTEISAAWLRRYASGPCDQG